MKRLLPVISIAVMLVLFAGPAMAKMKGEVNLFLGMKNVKDSDFERIEFLPPEEFPNSTLDVSSMSEYGIGANFGGVDWPVMIAVDFLMASEDDAYNFEYYGDYQFRLDAELETTEIDVGVRKFWTNHDKFHPYVGGGVAFIDADAELALFGPDVLPLRQTTEWFSQCASDSGTGLWLNTGVLWRITPRLSLGFDLRYSDASVDFVFDDEIVPDRQVEEDGTWKADVGGLHYGLLFGFRW